MELTELGRNKLNQDASTYRYFSELKKLYHVEPYKLETEAENSKEEDNFLNSVLDTTVMGDLIKDLVGFGG